MEILGKKINLLSVSVGLEDDVTPYSLNGNSKVTSDAS